MLPIDLKIACHRKPFPKNVKATKKVVFDLVAANFIFEAKYITWLFNIVLVRKSNNNWCICVDYTNLNKAYHKDMYPFSI